MLGIDRYYFLLFVLLTPAAFSQETLPQYYKPIQMRLHYGFIIAHSEAVQNTAGSNPAGVEVELFKQRVDSASWKLCRCYPNRGFSFSYFNFDNEVLGHGFTTAYFLEPSYKLNSRLQFRFRGSAGISYLTNPHSEKNPMNMSYSSNISGYLQVGVSVAQQVATKWLVQAGVNYQHLSNGGLKQPNKGINWPTASIGLSYMGQPYRLPRYTRTSERFTRNTKPYWEAGLLLSAKQGFSSAERSRTPLAGVLLQVAKQVGGTNALNAGIEMYYDNALRQQLKQEGITGSAFRSGILAGHDFLLGKFYFSQQIGFYLYLNAPYYDRIYHRWAFRYRFADRWFAGFALKAHRQVADFIDLRVIYSLDRKADAL